MRRVSWRYIRNKKLITILVGESGNGNMERYMSSYDMNQLFSKEAWEHQKIKEISRDQYGDKESNGRAVNIIWGNRVA